MCVQGTQRCALLIKRHALSPFAAPAGLSSTVQCCVLALVHCRALQASHSLALAPSLLRELWPACDQVPCLPSPCLSFSGPYQFSWTYCLLAEVLLDQAWWKPATRFFACPFSAWLFPGQASKLDKVLAGWVPVGPCLMGQGLKQACGGRCWIAGCAA